MSRKSRQDRKSSRSGGTVPARISQGRELKTTVLIVCEGKETERNYLYQLKLEESATKHFTVTVKSAKGKSRVQAVRAAVAIQKNSSGQYDEVWCVMDVEGPQHLADLRKAIALAQRNEIVLYLSNPAFEVWLLAHFDRIARSFNGCDAVVSVLDKLWRKKFQQGYDKSDRLIYQRLSVSTQDAVGNAQWVRETHHRGKADTVDCNSSTEFYKLVKRLLTPSGS